MSHTHEHGQVHHELLEALTAQLQPLLEASEQGIYIFLDDEHKVCNENFAAMLGYNSAEEWAGVEGSFPDLFVAEESQNTLIGAYQRAMETLAGSTINVKWKTVEEDVIDSTVILVPISYEGHLFALHFIE